MPYATAKPKRRAALPPYPLARLFMVTASRGCRFMERRSLNSTELGMLPKGTLFHVELAGVWVHRLPSEGGGYCWGGTVKEVV